MKVASPRDHSGSGASLVRGCRRIHLQTYGRLREQAPDAPSVADVRGSCASRKSKVAVQKALDETQLLFDSLMQEYFG